MHGSTHTVKFRRDLVQRKGVIGEPGHHTFDPFLRKASQIECLPASNIWESSNNVDANTVQLAQLFIESHEPHGNWLAFRPGQRVVSEKGVKKLMLAGKKLFHQGKRLQHVHNMINAGNVPTLVCGRLRTFACGWMKLFS